MNDTSTAANSTQTAQTYRCKPDVLSAQSYASLKQEINTIHNNNTENHSVYTKS